MILAPKSLVDILRWRSENQPDRIAYRFLADGEYEAFTITYKELDRRARSIGALLQASAKPGDRALLLFPPGLDFVAAFYGCLYAKILAIPVYPPHPARLEKTVSVIRRIAADAKPAVALLTTPLFNAFKAHNAIRNELGNLKMLVTDNGAMYDWADEWEPPEIHGQDIAFLQYTSGSTTIPKGVMVSHGNLIHNMGLIKSSFRHSEESHNIIWLPPYHDMGLIGGIMQPLYAGYQVTLLPHTMFLQRPLRWLQAVSHYRGTTSGGPNFAYELCLKKITPEQRDQLDLSTWDVAFNGAEPVYHNTLDRFADYFAPCGFRREAFFPCYGLAEATLIVSGGPKARPLLTQNLITSSLEQNHVFTTPETGDGTRTLVSCGPVIADQKVRIVNPETFSVCPADQIGEIWLRGPSVAKGYWNKPMETESTFGARVSDDNDGPYLRTGDLGFLYDGELYVTGRLKDLIIVDGKNHYAHDLERTLEASHPAIRTAGCAVFYINHDEREEVIVLAEVEYKLAAQAEEIIKAVRQAIAMEHELHVYDIKLIQPGGIPRTTSGKIRRFLCKSNYMAGALEEITTT